jgi:hypothetical protein
MQPEAFVAKWKANQRAERAAAQEHFIDLCSLLDEPTPNSDPTGSTYPVLPDKNLIVIPREDDLMFGILHSRFHKAWAMRKGSDLEDRPRYTHTTTFATFPFPEGMAPSIPEDAARSVPTAPAIEAAAERLNNLRNAWLYPKELIVERPEIGNCLEEGHEFPPRLLPIDEAAKRLLANRTLTNLYNEYPDWLAEAHRELDVAVARAYGWPVDISEKDALAALLAFNLERSKVG